LFHSRLAHAHKYLESLDAKTKMDPGWFMAMLELAQDEGWQEDKAESLFQDAVTAHPYFLTIYFYRYGFYDEKWGGTPQQMTDCLR
jgi:hypothetical protein